MIYPVLALAALSTVKSQVVHVVTTPANQPLWTTLCDDADGCDVSYDQMGLPPDNVRDHDATEEDYYPVVRVNDVLRFNYAPGHDVVKMTSGHTTGCGLGGQTLSDDSGEDGETGTTTYDYVVTTEDFAAGTIYFSCSYPDGTYDHCREGQRVAVEVSEPCADEACTMCKYPKNTWSCWKCKDGYAIQDEEYRCKFYNCEGKCIEAKTTPTSKGSCYTFWDHTVSCDVDKADCGTGKAYYEPGYVGSSG